MTWPTRGQKAPAYWDDQLKDYIDSADAANVPATRQIAGLDLSADRTAAALKTALGITEADVAGLTTDLAALAPLASPALTGNPTAPTPVAGDNDTSVATTAFVQSSLSARTPQIVTATTATAAATAAKAVTVSGYTPVVGDLMVLTFTNGNLASLPTIAVNGGVAGSIKLGGNAIDVTALFTSANAVALLQFDGTAWNLLGPQTIAALATTAAMQAGTSTTVAWMTPALVKASVANSQINTQTGAYTFALADAGKRVEGNSATAQTLTIPPNSSVAFAIGTKIDVHQYGAGQITIAPGAGVTLRSRGSLTHTIGQYSVVRLYKRATDEWILSGDLA